MVSRGEGVVSPALHHLSLFSHVPSVGPDVAVLEPFITVVQGSAATLTCTAAGQPTPSIVWLRNGEEVPTNSTPRLSLTTGVGMASLMISSVASEDEGMWVCVGSNIAGSNQQSITLSVLGESLTLR